jgi:ribosomal protein S12 methylthiotransferase
VPYVDLPIQHANDAILGRMGRKIDQAGIRDLIGRIRAAVPEAVIRTSLIVGFPGEGDEEFNELLDFVREMRFERLGAFAYSQEADTPAGDLPGQVDADVKEERLGTVLELQQDIADEQSEALVGTEVEVVVDGKGPDGEWAGRTVRDAPDVDGAIRFDNTDLKPGMFGRALITDAYGYDLVGKFVVPDDDY